MSDKQFVLKEMIYSVKERARDCPLLTPTDIVYEVNKKVNADLKMEIHKPVFLLLYIIIANVMRVLRASCII